MDIELRLQILYTFMFVLMSSTVSGRSFLYSDGNNESPCVNLDINFNILFTADNGVVNVSTSRTERDVKSVLGSCERTAIALTFPDDALWSFWFHQDPDGSERLYTGVQFTPRTVYGNNISHSDIISLNDAGTLELFKTFFLGHCDQLYAFNYATGTTEPGKTSYTVLVVISKMYVQAFDMKGHSFSSSEWCLAADTTATASSTNSSPPTLPAQTSTSTPITKTSTPGTTTSTLPATTSTPGTTTSTLPTTTSGPGTTTSILSTTSSPGTTASSPATTPRTTTSTQRTTTSAPNTTSTPRTTTSTRRMTSSSTASQTTETTTTTKSESTTTAGLGNTTEGFDSTTAIPTTPSKPPVKNYTVSADNVDCILFQGAFKINIDYAINSSQSSTNTVSVDVPADATSTGSCNYTFDSQNLVISFLENWSLEFVFTVEEEASAAKATSDASYGITNITLVYVIDSERFPDSANPPNTKITVYPRSAGDADYPRKASSAAFYQCDSTIDVKLHKWVTLQASQLEFKAFNANDSITFDGSADHCLADETTSHTVPIIVGCSLAGLGVFAVTIYATVRCRSSHRRSYFSI